MSHNVSVCISFDFDAMSSWIANYRTESPNALSRGEFGRVGAHRALDLLRENDVPSTWFVPGHTIEAFRDTVRQPPSDHVPAEAARDTLDVCWRIDAALRARH